MKNSCILRYGFIKLLILRCNFTFCTLIFYLSRPGKATGRGA